MGRALFSGLAWCIAIGMPGGCGPLEGEDLGSLGLPIINGTLASEPRHQAVVAVIVNGNIGYCTGTLITPTVVLTAAHCIEGFDSNTVMFGDSVQSPSAVVRKVIQRWVHPAYGQARFWHDIGLLRLEKPAPAEIAPIPPLPEALGIAADDIGRELEFVGFGYTDPALKDYGVRRRVLDDIGLICNDPAGCHASVLIDTIPDRFFCHDQAPGGICMGDSGGPGLIEREGILYVAGVNSFSSEQCDVIACGARVDAYEAEILDFIGRADGDACERDDQCLSAHCAQGVCCATVCFGGCRRCDDPATPGVCVELADDTACDDGDACTSGERCLGGLCTAGITQSCDDGDPCTLDHCQGGEGCAHEPLPAGTVCGTCRVCDAAGACAPAPDGTACADADRCDGEEVCRAGACEPGPPADCDDGDPCTLDDCSPGAGCLHPPAPDGEPCGDGRICWEGTCVRDGGTGKPGGMRIVGVGCRSAPGAAGGGTWLGWLLILAAGFCVRTRNGRP